MIDEVVLIQVEYFYKLATRHSVGRLSFCMVVSERRVFFPVIPSLSSNSFVQHDVFDPVSRNAYVSTVSRIFTLNLYGNYRQSSRRNTGPNVITPTVTGINVTIPYIRVLSFFYFFTALFFKTSFDGGRYLLAMTHGFGVQKGRMLYLATRYLTEAFLWVCSSNTTLEKAVITESVSLLNISHRDSR